MSLGYSSVWFKHYCPISASSCVYASLESVIPATLKLLLSHLLKMHPLTWGSYPVPWYIPYIQVVNGEALCRKGEVGVNELVQQLREMAAGSDIETAEYMIQDIFEEYRFFGQYPGDKLRTTAALMGSLIAQAVFGPITLYWSQDDHRVLRGVFEAARYPLCGLSMQKHLLFIVRVLLCFSLHTAYSLYLIAICSGCSCSAHWLCTRERRIHC